MTEKQSGDMTISEMFKGMDEWGAGVAKLITRKADDTPVTAAIFVRGEGTEEVLEAVEVVERRWDEDDRVPVAEPEERLPDEPWDQSRGVEDG